MMSDLNLPDKDDAPWLDTTYDGFMTGAELGFNTWFNDDTYGPYSYRCEWFFGDCEVEDVKTRKDLLYKWIHAAYCAGYSENKALKALDKLHKENEKGMKKGMKELAVEGSQSFYNQLWELLETELGDTVLCDQMADRIYDLVKEHYQDIDSDQTS